MGGAARGGSAFISPEDFRNGGGYFDGRHSFLSEARNSFIVWDTEKLFTTLLPRYFKHNTSPASFASSTPMGLEMLFLIVESLRTKGFSEAKASAENDEEKECSAESAAEGEAAWSRDSTDRRGTSRDRRETETY